MTKRRLNDTSAIATRSSGVGADHSISTRKIDNGYVVSESSFNPATGEFKRSESFQAEAPKVIPGKVEKDDSAGGGLRDTMNYLSDGE